MAPPHLGTASDLHGAVHWVQCPQRAQARGNTTSKCPFHTTFTALYGSACPHSPSTSPRKRWMVSDGLGARGLRTVTVCARVFCLVSASASVTLHQTRRSFYMSCLTFSSGSLMSPRLLTGIPYAASRHRWPRHHLRSSLHHQPKSQLW